jgi:hypothetical protein
MAHHDHEDENLSPEDKIYKDFIRRGNDFYNIDLFLSAKYMFADALKIRPNDEFAQERFNKCKSNIKRDTVRVLTVVPIVAGIIIGLFYILM